MRSQAKFSYGLTLLALNQPKEALPLLRDYAKEAPEDPNAKRALANAYSATGQTDSATALQKEILASGDVSSGTGGTDGGASANDALTIGHNLYREKKYADAAAAFEKVLATEPNNRDALYWAGYSYVGTADGAKLLDAGKRLLALEPYNEEARKMMGQGYELTKNEAARTATATELRATPLKIEVKSWTTKADGASLGLAATGRQGITKTGKMITATPITLTFEMLDAKGGVVATKDVQLPAISPGQSQDLTVDVTGQGIVGFRYKKKA
jgi:tetratricopeptide (TPR) repeat protein